ncbi:MAG TPA: hypothetical protein VM553_08550 [Dongiaceae bacterium]|nr:hypothetical protein [Dongiaceae bacterium]
MLLKLLLGLRNNAHQVDVVKLNGETRPVLGTSHPQEEDRRANILRQWGMHVASPRQERLAGIDQPLPQRTQTILSHQIDPDLRQQINSGMGTLSDSRQNNQPGIKERAAVRRPDEQSS